MEKKWIWSNGHGKSGESGSEAEALVELQKVVDFVLEDCETTYSPDGSTTYYYETEDDMNNDADGAYAAQISEVQ